MACAAQTEFQEHLGLQTAAVPGGAGVRSHRRIRSWALQAVPEPSPTAGTSPPVCPQQWQCQVPRCCGDISLPSCSCRGSEQKSKQGSCDSPARSISVLTHSCGRGRRIQTKWWCCFLAAVSFELLLNSWVLLFLNRRLRFCVSVEIFLLLC